jgi:UDP-glucose 4-epimerase
MNSSFSGKKVLITGGAGFLGSHLANYLVSASAKVVIVDSLIPKYGGNQFNLREIKDKAQVNYSDVRDSHGLRYLIHGVDYLFNLAGQSSHLDSMHDPFTDLEINCYSQLSILEICREVNPNIKIIFASTRQIYGCPNYLPVDEKHPIVPVDVNGINKSSGEMYHQLYNKVYGIRTCCLRMTNTIGPHMRIKDARQTFVGIWVKNLIEGKPIEVWGGDQIRDFTYVTDCVDAFLLAASHKECDGHFYNIGGCRINLRELAELMIKINGGGELVIKEFPEERKAIDIGDYYSNDEKFRATTKWSPKYNLERAITETLAFYKANLQHYL